MSEWISVKDRLPEEGEDVLIIEEDGCIDVGHMLRWKGKSDWNSHLFFEPKVTYWMPIPEPPEEGGL